MLSNEDTVSAFLFEQNSVPHYGAAIRVREDYQEFCRLNQIDPMAVDSYISVVGQMTVSGLAAGTINLYLGYLDAPSAVRSGTELRHAAATTKHATDLPEGELKDLITVADEETGPTQYLMWATGAHAADANALERKNLSLKFPRLIVTWQVTKSIRVRSARDTLVYDLTGFPPPKSFLNSLRADPDSKPWNASAAKINKHLDGASTSLVYRRAFEHRYRKDGYSEEEIGRLLTHQGVKMVRAHYGQSALNHDDDDELHSEDCELDGQSLTPLSPKKAAMPPTPAAVSVAPKVAIPDEPSVLAVESKKPLASVAAVSPKEKIAGPLSATATPTEKAVVVPASPKADEKKPAKRSRKN